MSFRYGNIPDFVQIFTKKTNINNPKKYYSSNSTDNYKISKNTSNNIILSNVDSISYSNSLIYPKSLTITDNKTISFNINSLSNKDFMFELSIISKQDSYYEHKKIEGSYKSIDSLIEIRSLEETKNNSLTNISFTYNNNMFNIIVELLVKNKTKLSLELRILTT